MRNTPQQAQHDHMSDRTSTIITSQKHTGSSMTMQGTSRIASVQLRPATTRIISTAIQHEMHETLHDDVLQHEDMAWRWR